MKPERIAQVYRQGEASESALVTAIVDMEDAELLHLLRCARVVAELENLHSPEWLSLVELCTLEDGRWNVCVDGKGDAIGPDLLTAVEAALARAKETT